MQNEVEDFLRRVAQMRAQAEAQAKNKQRPTTSKPPRQPARQQPPPPQPPPPARLVPARSEEPVPVEIVDAELATRSDRVSRLVDQDFRGTQQIGDHARRLGAEVDAADDKLQAHLNQVFDHKLGHLKSSSVETALVESEKSAPQLSLDQIMRLLRSPGSVRDAIVMSEVLRRPTW